LSSASPPLAEFQHKISFNFKATAVFSLNVILGRYLSGNIVWTQRANDIGLNVQLRLVATVTIKLNDIEVVFFFNKP